ncbi:MAG: peptidoglycan-binding domain-containing protein [Bacteroidales bacterium]
MTAARGLAMGLAVATALSGCGSTREESAATGGLGGAAIGALAGGPIGAAIGLGAGAAAGTGVEIGQERGVIPPEPGDQAAARTAGDPDLRHAQMALRDEGLYDGPIDGVNGPRTRHALSQYQRRTGLPQTARLDNATRDSLQSEVAALPEENRPRTRR